MLYRLPLIQAQGGNKFYPTILNCSTLLRLGTTILHFKSINFDPWLCLNVSARHRGHHHVNRNKSRYKFFSISCFRSAISYFHLFLKEPGFRCVTGKPHTDRHLRYYGCLPIVRTRLTKQQATKLEADSSNSVRDHINVRDLG